MKVSLNPSEVTQALNFAVEHYPNVYTDYDDAKKKLYNLIHGLVQHDCYWASRGAFSVTKVENAYADIPTVDICIRPKVADYEYFVIDTEY